MSLADWFTVCSLTLIVIGLLFNLIAIRKGNSQKRAEFLNNLYIQFASDNLLDIYYKLEYDKIKSIPEESQDEKNLDQLLGFFDNIGHLIETRNLTWKDVEYFALEIISVYKKDVVKKYIQKTQEYYKTEMKIKDDILPFSDFQRIAEKLVNKYQI